jgi:predicted protein tyrosine phosphatase
LVPDQVLVGDYPGGPDVDKARHKIERLLKAGITYFLDLTEEGERVPYAQWIGPEAVHHRAGVPDWSVPTAGQMAHILDLIDAALAAGDTVYVHCYFGIGRSAAVAGCYLVRHGTEPAQALETIERLRAETPKADYPAPATEEQRRIVMSWQPGR